MSDELEIAIEAARIGAKKALQYFDNNSDLNTKIKSDSTPVTIADPATEEVIKSYIVSKFKDAKILGEESGGSTNEESFWIIDPIDGTRVYARGINTWAVMVSYFSKGTFEIGVCYFPLFDEIYFAQNGKGAYMNGKKLTVSKTTLLKNALINSGNPKHYKNRQIILDLVENAPVVRSYETTYADCLVAAGKMDASVDPYAKLWDFAAFVPIVQEAGGKITNLKGEKPGLNDNGCIITNGLLHNELVKIVNKY
jgi:histidinol phosphatase-like enzyme (inositol monophosphatase family)